MATMSCILNNKLFINDTYVCTIDKNFHCSLMWKENIMYKEEKNWVHLYDMRGRKFMVLRKESM